MPFFTNRMDSITPILGGAARARIMRLFVLNPDKTYELSFIEKFCKATRREAEREVLTLQKSGLVRHRRFLKEGKHKRIKTHGWTLNNSFTYLKALRSMLVESALLKSRDIVKRLQKSGALKLVVLSGVFIQNWDSRIDLLVVADKPKKAYIERTLRSMEVELGRELHYAVLTTTDFQYRTSVGDKLVRDIFDFPHRVALNKQLIAK